MWRTASVLSFRRTCPLGILMSFDNALLRLERLPSKRISGTECIGYKLRLTVSDGTLTACCALSIFGPAIPM